MLFYRSQIIFRKSITLTVDYFVKLLGAAVVASEVTTVVVVPSTVVVVMVTGFVALLGDDVVVQVG